MILEAEHAVTISHPEKVLWPQIGFTKIDYIRYLIDASPYLLQHLNNRPLTVIRFPDGVNSESFFQKDAPKGTPPWVTTTPVWSPDRQDYIHYILVDSVATLIWLGNLACLEFHIGFTTTQNEELPTHIAFDLDPTVPGFERVRAVALKLHELLDGLQLTNRVKTSGATGLQVFIPLKIGYTFEDTKVFTEAVAQYLSATLPDLVTLERLKKNRGNKVYVDIPQHGSGRTLIAPYSARSTSDAKVSTPITWAELAQGAVPEDFTVAEVPSRLKTTGDLFQFKTKADIAPILQFLQHHTMLEMS
ncbi:non-homologous end-joining DNA ligase [Alicyclobacillus sp. SO9]|uniref:non-homologous end-joining DNA ligase n=1 Tax=Alicyclobacillus sp. SO9 TaxID=2665646 RepID=UPI0018E85EC9|nr:non-homologous end-joining DNA ligase [Alicyclobacillus sp. SO9]QQE76776.1 non-homologous end-joining DNA ligase [Alicyclobacillus sp. SO9]